MVRHRSAAKARSASAAVDLCVLTAQPPAAASPTRTPGCPQAGRTASPRVFHCDRSSVAFDIRTLSELRDAGIPASTVHTRARRGQYTRLLPQVYALREPSLLARCYAVTRWQPAAVLSHHTAAWLWHLGDEPAVVEATVPRAVSVRAPSWLRLHRRQLQPSWVTDSYAMAVVTPERALLDVLGIVAADDALSLAELAPSRGANLRTTSQLLQAGRGMHGAAAARTALRHAVDDAASLPERLLGRELVGRGIRLRGNARVGRFVCDFVDDASRTIIEVDGRQFHSAADAFVSDRRRQNQLQLAGWLVLRYAAADVLADARAVADEIAAALRLRRSARRAGRWSEGPPA